MRRGEVWWYEPPDEKARPHLILTRDLVIDRITRPLAVPTTTQARGIPSEVDLDQTDGMPVACVLTLDHLRPIRREYCSRRITVLGPVRLDEVCRALRIAIDC